MHSVSISPYFASIICTKNKQKFLLPSLNKHHRNLQIRAMRAVVQRVASASVEVDGRIVSEIGPSLLVLVGIHDSDTESDADYICRKVLNMRLFTNENTGKGWDQNVMQRNYGVLLDGVFGAMMKVSLVNDGPVTMQLDSSQPSKNTTGVAEES
ncbi:hypothetical protein ES288_D10G033800v1 [Gossypium darwinii]|uniref:D-aminoacyl-tRNA deacylase n=1 Tax=Gossypium darwinii TaxID=34276 RepID=A0A5D2AW41_GOSDA|nr:hypothetical protein ES288_D10G033800v1 [Gossypium darwinii]